MTGIENIVKSIDKETELVSAAIINKAEEEAKIIKSKAETIAENETSLIIKNAEDKSNRILKRADSQMELQRREMLLRAKREQIDYMIDEAKNTLRNLPDDEYFEFILKLCKKYIQPRKAELIFSKIDLNRVSQNFKTSISSLSKSIGGDIKISEVTRDINGGFILSYGDIEENCSFDALFDSENDLLSDKVNELLF